jgi:hypothetical protein
MRRIRREGSAERRMKSFQMVAGIFPKASADPPADARMTGRRRMVFIGVWALAPGALVRSRIAVFGLFRTLEVKSSAPPHLNRYCADALALL